MKESLLSSCWSDEKNTVEIEAVVMKESLLNRSWSDEKNTV